PIIPQHTEIQDDYSPPEFSKAIAYEQESIKISDTSMTPISLNSSGTEQPQIPISEEAQAEDITLSHNGGIEESAEIILGQEQGVDQQNLLRHVPQRIASRAGDVSADLTEENILPESTKRPRKAPRRDIYSSAGNYDIFYTAMTAAVTDPEVIGRKLPFISTLSPPPNTWKQMVRHSEST
ncbi:hypothetical protein K3495_g17308, partial [Podosphaera aphanis]